MSPDQLLILIAPNVSQQMGGEAIKALQIFEQFKKQHPNTVQITHGRNRAEVERLQLPDVHFVDDTPVAIAIWKSVVLRPWLDVWFSVQAVRLAETIARQRGAQCAVIQQTEPNSPVAPRSLSRRHVNVFGPINGNIFFPELFRSSETTWNWLRRIWHMPLQKLNRLRPGGIKEADQILVAGGNRNHVSLRAAGCPPEILRDTLDCGIPDQLLNRPRVDHRGQNFRFIHFGRLVFHKGTALVIESLAKTGPQVCLDVIGRGPELEKCRALTARLGLDSRVRFLDWYTDQSELFDSFAVYRGMVLPSLEDANGIVVQEAMAMGLPPICLEWGGPALLIEHARTGFLVPPASVDQITSELAKYMDLLAGDGERADEMSQAARSVAQDWRWSVVAAEWIAALPTTRRFE